MSGVPKKVHVNVILHPAGSNPPFHFATTDLPLGPNNVLTFVNSGHPGFHVYYDLDDSQNPGYLFPDSPIPDHLGEALYSKPQAGCPNNKGQWGQFKALGVENSGKTLLVHNRNQSIVNFGYTLRVTKDGGASYLPLDPGGVNQNGPQRNFSLAVVLIVGAVVGSLLTIGAEALLQG